MKYKDLMNNMELLTVLNILNEQGLQHNEIFVFYLFYENFEDE